MIERTREKWLFFVDNDITIKTENWLDYLAIEMFYRPEREAFICRIYDVEEREDTFIGKFVIVNKKAMMTKLNDKKTTNFFPGGGSVVNRILFKRLGKYDSRIFVGYEDFELALRAIKNKSPIKAAIVKEILLYHSHPVLDKVADKKTVYKRYNKNLLEKSVEIISKKHGIKLNQDLWWLDRIIGIRVGKIKLTLWDKVKLLITYILKKLKLYNVVARIYIRFRHIR